VVDTTTVAESSCLSATECPGQDSNPRGITPNGFLGPEHWPNWPAYKVTRPQGDGRVFVDTTKCVVG
jgi:hypothetical protein